MSKETALQFLSAVERSPELQQQLKSLQEDTPETIKRVIEMAAQAGYTFCADDLRAAARSRAEQQMQTGEISEEDLEKVAGGTSDNIMCTIPRYN